MAKASASKKRQTAGPECADAAENAARIAGLDSQIATLIQQRGELLKAANAAAAASCCAAGFDDLAISKTVESVPGALPKNAMRSVFREILSGCRALVRPLRIACLGPLYSYSHLAALHRFGRAVEFVPVGTISAVFEEVNQGHAEFGLVPVENSTDGRIADTLEMFVRLPVRICGQVDMHIHHTLLAKCPRSAVKEVYSKPQAISQCRNWLARHLPAARAIEVTSTTMAAQLAAEKPGAAAIASHPAATEYGLDVLAENIEDNPHNSTRFAVIGGQVPARTGNDRTAILFQMEHRPGTLADATNVFKRNKLNLTWIESFPAPGSDRAYLFFAEIETHPTELKFRRAMAALQRKALRLEVLGAFPVTEPVG
jgi:chorismate mutase / prephenate dehydratase